MGLCCTKSKTHERPTSSSNSSPHNQRQETVNPTPPKPAPKNPLPASSFLPPETAPSSTQIGKILGKPYVDITKLYVFDRELASGQFGITHICAEKATGLKYACKSLSTRGLVTVEGIEGARREVTILQHLSGQPNIAEFKGAYEDMHNLHLVTELCSGGELFDRITARGRYSEREAARICRQILNVVKVCHFMGVMHRDLKPENLLFASMDEDAPLKVTGFGLSAFIEEGQLEMDSLNSVFVKL